MCGDNTCQVDRQLLIKAGKVAFVNNQNTLPEDMLGEGEREREREREREKRSDCVGVVLGSHIHIFTAWGGSVQNASEFLLNSKNPVKANQKNTHRIVIIPVCLCHL